MNNDLEQFSEEELNALSNVEVMTWSNAITASELAALARIALSVKQAKPVAWILNNGPSGASHIERDVRIADLFGIFNGNTVEPLYTTPQSTHTEKDGWIKCSERMPDEEGMYQCWGKFFANDEYGYFCSSYRPHIKPMWVPVEDDCDPIDVSVTHWMPLPAAPKPENKK